MKSTKRPISRVFQRYLNVILRVGYMFCVHCIEIYVKPTYELEFSRKKYSRSPSEIGHNSLGNMTEKKRNEIIKLETL